MNHQPANSLTVRVDGEIVQYLPVGSGAVMQAPVTIEVRGRTGDQIVDEIRRQIGGLRRGAFETPYGYPDLLIRAVLANGMIVSIADEYVY